METITSSSYECPISTCGRRFEDAEKLQVHVSRRHPEYRSGEVSKKDSASDSNEKDNSSAAIINNTTTSVNAAKTATVVIPCDDKKQPTFTPTGSILGRPPSSSKNKATLTTAAIKPCSPRVAPAAGSDNLRRSQELFRRSAENLQLVAEKTRGKSLDNQQEASIEAQERKQQKAKEVKEKAEKDLKRQQSMQVDKELIESIMFELNRANDPGKQQLIGLEGNNAGKESERVDIVGIADDQDEVMSEEEGDD